VSSKSEKSTRVLTDGIEWARGRRQPDNWYIMMWEETVMTEWSKKRVLVTGGASFIGSHLVERLAQLGAHVCVADDFSSGQIANLQGAVDAFPGRLEVRRGDLKDRSFANDVTKDVDRVFHLACIHGGRGFIDTHPADCSSNMILDGNVIEACKNNGVKHITFASSACVYPPQFQDDGESKLLTEEMADPANLWLSADREYGWSKLMCEMSLRAYYKQYGLKSASCRFSTAYGPRENETHAIIALIAKAFIRQDPYEIWGNGQQSRNFTYVSDIVDGIIRASERISDAQAVNLGSKELYSTNTVAHNIFEIVEWNPKNIHYNSSKPTGVFCRATSDEKARTLLGMGSWTPLREGLEKTIRWYFSTHKTEDVSKRIEMLLEERVAQVDA